MVKMQAELPVFFSDRDPVALLDREADTTLKAMRDWGIGRVDERETVHFCGLVYHPERGAIAFLPRESKTGNPSDNLKTASLTMRALARFGAETSKRDFDDDGEAGNPGVLSVIKRLADDFKKHGLFSERVRHWNRNSGKPDWINTIKREIAMPGQNNQPVFTNIRTSRFTRTTDALLAQIQAAVIREIKLAHAWWLPGMSRRLQELVSCSNPPYPRSSWVSRLDALLPTLFSTRSVFLARYLRFYLRETRAYEDGSFIFGVNDFHTVWETILRETIIRSPYDRRLNWNSTLPKPVYRRKDNDILEARSRGMQTDIILEDVWGYTIVDAKYYAAKSAKTAPGWPDIAKQMFYEKALREVVDTGGASPTIIHNVFAFPSKTGEGPLAYAETRHINGEDAGANFPPISCSYVSIGKALDCYANSTRGIQLTLSSDENELDI